MARKKKPFNRTVGQIIAAIFLSAIFYFTVDHSKAYMWIFGVMQKNLKYIKEHPDLSYEQKMQVKHGFTYKYCDFINKHTDENAIIIIPSREAIRNAKELDNKKTTSASLSNKAYATYFIYPRVFIYPDEKEENPLWDKTTHVAIIDGHGYEYLNYKVQKKAKYQLLPIKK